MASQYVISDGELRDRFNTIEGITNRDILRAGDGFNKHILPSRCFRKEHQNTFVVIQEVEVRMLQDILRGLPPVPEREVLADSQTYLEYVNSEITVQLEWNNYKYVLMPKSAYRELCDMLYNCARLGMVKINTIMLWRELTKFLTPAQVSFDKNPYGCGA